MSRRFQGLCLVADEGWEHMEEFDNLPQEVKERLRESEFNLCPACVDCAGGVQAMFRRIEKMENELRCVPTPTPTRRR